jgi:hypothetical protein
MWLQACVCTPSVANRSLMPSGMPSSAPPLPAAMRRIRGLCHVARLFRRHGDIGVERAVRRIDRAEIGVRQFDGGDLLGAQLFAGFGNGQAGQIGHGAVTSGQAARSCFW